MDDFDELLDSSVSLRIRGVVVRSVVVGRLSGPDVDRCGGVSHETAGDGPAVSWLPSPGGERIAVKSRPCLPVARGITVQIG